MTPKFWTSALAAMGLGAAMSAQAAPTVIIDFETLAAQAVKATPNKPFGTPMPLTDSTQHISFAGATVFHEKQTARDANYCCQAPAGHAGFIQSRDGIAGNSKVNEKIVVELVGLLAATDIESVRFDVATGSTDLEFIAIDARGAKTKFDFNPSSTAWAWVEQTLHFENLGSIKRIEFVNLGLSSAVFALDNLNFTLADGSGAVPEPAGLGLVALALAAVGLTTRKRRT